MKWNENSGGSTFEQAPVGTHIARCIKLIDLGTQEGEYQGVKNSKRQCVITWELPGTLMTEGESKGKPFTVSKFYTQSLGEKANLRKDLINWRGRDFTPEELSGFEAKNILGKPCMVSITLNDKAKAKVSGVMALPKGMPCPDQVNPSVIFGLDEFDKDVFESLGKGIKAMIEASPEYKNMLKGDSFVDAAQTFTNDDAFDQDIPF